MRLRKSEPDRADRCTHELKSDLSGGVEGQRGWGDLPVSGVRCQVTFTQSARTQEQNRTEQRE